MQCGCWDRSIRGRWGAEREAVHTAACFFASNDVLIDSNLSQPEASMSFCRCRSLMPSRRAKQRKGDGVNADDPSSFDLLSDREACRSEALGSEVVSIDRICRGLCCASQSPNDAYALGVTLTTTLAEAAKPQLTPCTDLSNEAGRGKSADREKARASQPSEVNLTTRETASGENGQRQSKSVATALSMADLD